MQIYINPRPMYNYIIVNISLVMLLTITLLYYNIYTSLNRYFYIFIKITYFVRKISSFDFIYSHKKKKNWFLSNIVKLKTNSFR